MTATLERPPTSAAAADLQGKRALAPWLLTGLAFFVLFWEPMVTLGRDWWSDPEAGHGLLLGPLALFLAWKRGLLPNRVAQPLFGLTILFGAVLLRYLSGLAAELFTLRMSMMMAAGGLVVFYFGFRQLIHWWLPTALLILSVPIPDVVLSSLALPLQLQASKFGAALLEWRHVPVRLAGNVIHVPGHSLFVTEACSGLRSLTALLALGVLIGGIWLRSPLLRAVLIGLTIPIAMFLNGLRVFITGFLVFHVDPSLGRGVMHYTEGWVIFVAAFLILGALAWALTQVEGFASRKRRP